MPREQEQFLDVVDRDTAERRWRAAIRTTPLGAERIALSEALGRVLWADVLAEVDVPAFDRSNVDGYAVRAADTFGASELSPSQLRLLPEEIATGVVPKNSVEPGMAVAIATGGMVPRGADAVVMVESTSLREGGIVVRRPVAPGGGVTFAGTDVARGELVLRRGTTLSARETGVLAAIGCGEVEVFRRPRVAILSTGNEIVAPGLPLPLGSVYDANTTILADSVRELGAEPVPLGIVGDDESALEEAIKSALSCDVILLSGGTSKGSGDLSYRVLARRRPGVIVHGVALKPGKPVCLGAVGETPVAILPGFPASATFTFHEFVAPLIRSLSGREHAAPDAIRAVLPTRWNSERGRTEYVLVSLAAAPDGPLVYPIGKGSGSVSAFGRADGFVAIAANQEYIEAGEAVSVVPIGRSTRPADLVAIGSHCVGLDLLLGLLADRGFRSKTLWVGSQGGLDAASRGACDIAGIHLLDPESGRYNEPFLPPHVRLLRGYARMQGLVFRRGDERFRGSDVPTALAGVLQQPDSLMVNRNRGSGTRVLIDGLLGEARPPGYAIEARSHNAVAAAIAQGRADWGVAIAPVAESYGLDFLPLREEQYDFAVPEGRWERPAVVAFRELLTRAEVRDSLKGLGMIAEESCR